MPIRARYQGRLYGFAHVVHQRQKTLLKYFSSCQCQAKVKRQGMAYATENFRLALLEYRPMKTDDQEIIAREVFWKKLLLSRHELFGYNKNKKACLQHGMKRRRAPGFKY